ncbi:methyltransferase domain-containing protein [Roseofilum sp. BLCC_M91]|uniref:Methyltransferase domain-containing protein n=1 Tax=Roseofilum halophilum BLCC-M91 TaxID=3022259 RepID=A0ABT7BK60_9CYAN|nr:methyltransferase domain-containing protein [Roseofilum halophilum]MDJ1179450.1 methyltransferase domain-containing protein [Roseofilum halophilum BLCC-M91]
MRKVDWTKAYQYLQFRIMNSALMLATIKTYSRIKRTFFKPEFPKDAHEINLHLGCGCINHPKFINIDIIPLPHIHYVQQIDDLSIFKDSSVDLIYASHCLEHFSHLKVYDVLQEWFRVLKKNGILRLSVPDFDCLLKIYHDNDCDVQYILGPLMGAQDYEYNFHYTVFNEKSLKDLLLETGFKTVDCWKPGSCELTTFNDCSDFHLLVKDTYYSVSLNLEARK